MSEAAPARASLPMYDPPELKRAVDAWWAGIAAAFRRENVDAPERLVRGLSVGELWDDPGLLFTQTCGYPLVRGRAGRLHYLATPRYDAPGCEGSDYCSWIVVAADAPAKTLEDLRGARCAINGPDSHSGCNALRALVAPLARGGRFFGSVTVTGGHAESLAQIARRAVDVAAIDCITYALLARCRPAAVAATRVIGRTMSAPGLPYVTRVGLPPDLIERLRAGLARAAADPGLASVRAELLIEGIDVLPIESYDRIAALEAEAKRQGYTELD
ncbi:MAG: phosphate/phosphite/phosphonate ABC transporter substrate-binding protein [Pseudomonadota bacterium]